MARKRFTVEHNIHHLREAEVVLAQGRRGLSADWRIGAKLLPLARGIWWVEGALTR